ncbi:MAG: hydrogenase maturation nickel metallochaperone HypA [Bryobacterales bacterium]|nr:hydrogenase maturation nickel metallochaperone HypA [Bryobacterales bacterium]
MGIASSILHTACAEAARRPGARVTRIGLRIGEWAGVDTESLRFCMETIAPFAIDIEYQPESLALDIVFLELEESYGTDCVGEESAERERSSGGGAAGAFRRIRDAGIEFH